jgi:hypothetical protein
LVEVPEVVNIIKLGSGRPAGEREIEREWTWMEREQMCETKEGRVSTPKSMCSKVTVEGYMGMHSAFCIVPFSLHPWEKLAVHCTYFKCIYILLRNPLGCVESIFLTRKNKLMQLS